MAYVECNDVEDIIDTCRIIVIYLLCSVFFVARGDRVNGWMFRICDDFMALDEYDWGQVVVDYLMKFMHKKSPKKVWGCTVLLQVLHSHKHQIHYDNYE